MSSTLREKAEMDRIVDVICAGMKQEERQRIRDRLRVKFFNGQPVHFWMTPVTQSDLDVTRRAGARVGGYIMDIPNSDRPH